jgi:mRNA interferase RelE/StbE
VKYRIQFKPQALKDIDSISRQNKLRIVKKIEEMSGNLKGDVKHLTDITPEYRLRVGDYRVLFEVENESIIVY